MSIKHYYQQKELARTHVIPYLEGIISNLRKLDILEVGCAEGGFIWQALLNRINAVGLEIDNSRSIMRGRLSDLIFEGDITDTNLSVELLDRCYDLIVMIDVIEHISDKQSAIDNIKRLLRYEGYLYITFPTKQSPFAGHQQNLKSVLRYFPYISYFPEKVIRFSGKMFKENSTKISTIIRNKYNAINEAEFEHLITKSGFDIIDKNFYLSRPQYSVRYGLPVIKAFNHATTFGCEYLLKYSPV
jgi:2-polyprenyl-3-methyl-5-hydroxy-6-metoxy-1,4-benzoquinol methylase